MAAGVPVEGGSWLDPTLIRLVRTRAGVADLGQCCPEVVGERVGAGDGVGAGLDGDGAVAAGGADELPDAPASGGLDPVADGQGGELNRQAGFDGVAFAVRELMSHCVALPWVMGTGSLAAAGGCGP